MSNNPALAAAQKAARNGEKLTRAQIRLLQIESDRLQDLALERAGLR